MKQTTKKKEFKAVEYMRTVRTELSDLYHRDKERFYDELKQATADFLSRRQQAVHNMGLTEARLKNKV